MRGAVPLASGEQPVSGWSLVRAAYCSSNYKVCREMVQLLLNEEGTYKREFQLSNLNQSSCLINVSRRRSMRQGVRIFFGQPFSSRWDGKKCALFLC